MKTKSGSRLDITLGYQIDIVTVHGSMYIAVRICAPLKYIFRFLYLGHHWKLVVIGSIFAFICLEPSARLNVYEYKDHMQY
jgi:hypothetical protein